MQEESGGEWDNDNLNTLFETQEFPFSSSIFPHIFSHQQLELTGLFGTAPHTGLDMPATLSTKTPWRAILASPGVPAHESQPGGFQQ